MVAMLPGVLRTALLAGSIAAVTLAGACATQAASAAGTTIITVQVANRDGSAPGPEAMKTVRDSLTSRLTGAGLGQVAVSADGSTLLVSMAGAHSVSELNLLLAPGELRFRKVIDSASELRMVAPDGPPGPVGAPVAGPTPAQSAVLAKLGAAATVAAGLSSPSQLDPDMTQRLEPFWTLTPAEVAALPVAMQFAVPQITCETLNSRPLGAIDDKTAQVVACDAAGLYKYLLDRTAVVGDDVADATAASGADGVGWKVELAFTASGAPKWTDLTAEAFTNRGGACRATSPNANGGAGVCQVAIVADNDVVSAPAIQAVIASNCEITGNYTMQTAEAMAAQIRGGAIPFRLTVVSIVGPSAGTSTHT
jgi:preprotein translocase subunit SecD